MNIFVPENLEKGIKHFGEDGIRWLNDLPTIILDIKRKWHIRIGKAFDHGGEVSWVAPVELEDGSEAVLKIGIPHDEARYESNALRFLDEQSAIRLLQASDDGFSMLLERCLLGTDLWSLDIE